MVLVRYILCSCYMVICTWCLYLVKGTRHSRSFYSPRTTHHDHESKEERESSLLHSPSTLHQSQLAPSTTHQAPWRRVQRPRSLYLNFRLWDRSPLPLYGDDVIALSLAKFLRHIHEISCSKFF